MQPIERIMVNSSDQKLKNRFYVLEAPIYPTPPLGQDMTQGQFLSGV